MPLALSMDLVTEYIHHLEFELHRAPTTVRKYRDELVRFMDRKVRLEPSALAEWVATGDSGEVLAPNTKNRRLVILRGFMKYLIARNILAADPTASIKRARVPRNRKTPLSVDDLRRVYAVLTTEPRSWRRTRDEAILLVLYNAGLRVSELRALDLEQVDFQGRVLRAAVRKGGGEVDAPLNDDAIYAFRAWLRVRPSGAERAVFIGGAKLGRLTVRFIQKRLHELGEAAGIRAPLHPHLVRSAHATTLSDEDTDILVIAQSLNHASIRTTQPYIWTSVRRLRRALAKLPSIRVAPSTDPDVD